MYKKEEERRGEEKRREEKRREGNLIVIFVGYFQGTISTQLTGLLWSYFQDRTNQGRRR